MSQTRGRPAFKSMTEEEQQRYIDNLLLTKKKEPRKNLLSAETAATIAQDKKFTRMINHYRAASEIQAALEEGVPQLTNAEGRARLQAKLSAWQRHLSSRSKSPFKPLFFFSHAFSWHPINFQSYLFA